MKNIETELENVLRIHRIRLAATEVREDFPLLRLYKSIEAYRMIATFHTVPVSQRMEVARALATGGGATVREQMLSKAFHKRMFPRSIDQLEAMEPAILDLEEEHCWQNREKNELLSALIRQSEEHLGKAEIRKCFLARFRKAWQSDILRSKHGGERYELAESLGCWNLVACLEFGNFTNQYHCKFILRHDHLEGSLRRLSLGFMLGLGDLRWDDISRETLNEDADKAVQLWAETRRKLAAFIGESASNLELPPGKKPNKPNEKPPVETINTPINEGYYYYFVNYQPDIEAALQDLRQREFEAGRYYPVHPYLRFPIGPDSPAPGTRHVSIGEALEAADEAGTRSILDITRVAEDPDFQAAAPFPNEELERYFGTVHPTKEVVAANLSFLQSIEPGHCMYLIVFEGERPSGLFFAGNPFD